MAITTSRIEPAAWQRLLGRAGKAADERALLAELLELWCRDRGAAGAALYLDEEPFACCEATWGEGPFPAERRSERGGASEGFERLGLPGGFLLWRPAAGDADGGEAGPLAALLGFALVNCRLRRRVKRQSFQANYRGVELEALYDVGLAIASTLDLDAVAEEILVRAVSLLDARRGALYLLAGDEYRLKSRFGGDARASFAAAGSDGAPADVLPGIEHLLAVPIAIEDDRRGFLAVADKESRTGVGPFSPEDRRTLALFANQAAIALENARLHREALEKERYERDLQLAAEIQRQILPKGVPQVPGFELAGWNRPAREVGGDYYDLIPLAPEEDSGRTTERLGVALADVSGKGVPAALMVSTLHSAVRLLMGRIGVESRLVERLNGHILASSAPNKFITLLVGELDAATGRFVYVNAGHNPGLVIRGGALAERLGPGGLPVGLLPGSSYQTGCLELAPGDLLCLYSDGITECLSRADEEFGETRLVELLLAAAGRPLPEIVREVERAVTAFAAGEPQGDDQTLVLLRRAG
ncbi:MAG TPA: SpoIIE family protein phosphatase [Thermoanaerobaculia bacterium]|nr:SpoIIE family protein phosphatase [Thermoanaerobaculia bacterium]